MHWESVVICTRCKGEATMKVEDPDNWDGRDPAMKTVECIGCNGTGRQIQIEIKVEVPYVVDWRYKYSDLAMNYGLEIEKFGKSKNN